MNRPIALYVAIGVIVIVVIGAFVFMSGNGSEDADEGDGVDSNVRSSSVASNLVNDTGPATPPEATVEAGIDESRAEETDASATMDTAADTATDVLDTGIAEEGEEPASIEIHLTGLPDEAAITLDGQAITGSTLRVPNDGERHRISVRAEGFNAWSRDVDSDEDTEIAVRMVPIVEDEPAASRESGEARPERPDRSDRPSRSERHTPRRPPSKAPTIYRDPGF